MKPNKIYSTLAVALLVTALSACTTQKFILKEGKDDFLMEDKLQLFILGGIGQTQTVDAGRSCGGANKVQRAVFQQTFLDGLITGLTNNIISPRTTKIYCTK